MPSLLPEQFHNSTDFFFGPNASLDSAPPPDHVVADAGGQFTTSITQQDLDSAFGLLGRLQGMPGVTQEQIDALAASIQAAVRSGDRNALTPVLESISFATTNAENLGRYQEREAEAERMIGENVGQLQTLGTDTNNLFNERISRLSGFLNTPGTIRSDPELAAALGEVENAIDTQVGRQRTTAAKNLSDSGLRASGKITDRVGNAELLGTAQKGLSFSNLLGNIQQQRDSLQDNRSQFNLGLTDALNNARSGGINQLSGLTQLSQSANQPLDLTTSGLTGLDIEGLNRGSQQLDFGNAVQVASLASGLINNSIAGANSLFGSGGMFGRGG